MLEIKIILFIETHTDTHTKSNASKSIEVYFLGSEWVSESHSVVSNSLQPHRLYSPWTSPGQNTGVGSLSILQEDLHNPVIKPRPPTLQADSLQLSHKGSPRMLELVAYPLSSESSQPRNQMGVSCTAGGFFTNWAIREALFSRGADLHWTWTTKLWTSLNHTI